jgi:glycosyltransferase A (GT-A) superfamily protein (DUF2064 family)
MDDRMREAVMESLDSSVRMSVIVDREDTDYVTVGRAELCRLLAQHALVCGLALGSASRSADKERERS